MGKPTRAKSLQRVRSIKKKVNFPLSWYSFDKT